MTPINQIDVNKVKELKDKGPTTIVDICDPASFRAGHIPNAINLSDNPVEQFTNDTDKNKLLVVYCYHSISSQEAAAYFSEQEFKEVSSMIGNFDAWRSAFPNSVRKA